GGGRGARFGGQPPRAGRLPLVDDGRPRRPGGVVMSRDARLLSPLTLAPPAVAAAPVPATRALAAAIGSAAAFSFDLYDLFLLLYLAPVLGPLFFPSSLPTLSLAAVYASFGVTVLMRPVGSAVFGGLADRHGRRWAMTRAV